MLLGFNSAKMQLPRLPMGEKRIRFLYLLGDSKADVQVSADSYDVHRQVLFLAADVLADSNIPKPNQPRIHSRFAKKGLGTKVNFQPNLTLEGIHGISNGIWFYTVQGVFQVIFQFYNRTKQLDCLTSLTELWKSSFNDPLVSPTTTVHMQEYCSSTHIWDIPIQTNVDKLERQNIQECGETIPITTSCGSNRKEEPDKPNCNKSMETSLEFREQECHHYQMDGKELENTLDLGSVVSIETDSPSNTDSERDRVHMTLYSCLQGLAEICDNDHQLQLVHILQMLLEDYYQSNQKVVFPFDLLHNFYVSHNKIPEICNQDNCWSGEHQHALCVISEWLGKEFHKYGPIISTRVMEFKAINIDHINDLPPAGQLVRILFPPAMHCLVVNWMGIKDANAEQVAPTKDAPRDSVLSDPVRKVRKQDVCYRIKCKDSELKRESRTGGGANLYPLMQIVLELLNETLISGAAHVLYTRLIH